jgi:serine/tyrosine/threonine adenylyltransferase
MAFIPQLTPSSSEHAAAPIPFDNTYARLPEAFYERVKPATAPAPRLLRVNEALARQLRIDPEFLKSLTGLAVLSGNEIAPGSEPIAQAYAGHQFGNFVPQLGDGRAILLGEVLDVSGKRYDLQLKGSGQTRFSRRGDGRAALGPVIREYIVSEAMSALGVPTTRSLAAVLTGENVMRERVLPGGVLTPWHPATCALVRSSILRRAAIPRTYASSLTTRLRGIFARAWGRAAVCRVL